MNPSLAFHILTLHLFKGCNGPYGSALCDQDVIWYGPLAALAPLQGLGPGPKTSSHNVTIHRKGHATFFMAGRSNKW